MYMYMYVLRSAILRNVHTPEMRLMAGSVRTCWIGYSPLPKLGSWIYEVGRVHGKGG